ncbi:uncharacterized protein LOC117604072 isoform X2 [Osmia lignaria lignaria]|uniref:uncharacterized protein LOC117604072 isoform X2 n=1 Tax=Osmia lignaria lignaria TaxID=1437193 RepID=UPI001478085B|nr:coiled-coil domain-containing protein R3HCC1L isoform X2 [Osmia lignaria]
MSLQDSLFSEDVEHDVTLFSRDKRRKRDPKLNGVQHKPNCATKDSDKLLEMGVEGRRSPSASPERVRVQRQAKSTPTVEIYRPPAARRARNEPQGNVDQVQAQPTDSSSIKTIRKRRPDRAVYVPRHRRSLETEGSPQSVEAVHVNRTVKDGSSSSSLSHGQSKFNVNLKETDADVQQSGECTEKGSNMCSGEDQSNLEREDSQCLRGDSKDTVSTTVPEESTVESNVREKNKQSDSLNDDVPKETNNFSINDVKCEITNAFLSQTIEEQEVSNNSSENKGSLNSFETCVYSEEVNINEEVDRSDEYKDNINTTDPATNNNMNNTKLSNKDEITNQKNAQMIHSNIVSEVLIISNAVQKEPQTVKESTPVPITPPESKKVKKVVRHKSKPAPPPSPPVKKINRDECDWDSLFDDNGDCLDPTLIEELTSAVGDVVIEQPKSDYKTYTKHIEVSSDEFAHVVEIYNFPSEFKTSDLAAVFSPFKNGGFELKWVDDTHCLGVFSSPLVAAEVLASDHPFVKTRPLSEATALSKTKAKRSAEFLQPYRSRPETCAALARRLVTGALGVKLATARQEREHEKNILREAKEKRRLANKQREDAWEGIIPEK